MNSDIYSNLLEFITDKRRMRMSHIYQPVMLMTLLRNGGKSPVERIAKEFLIRDPSQIDYYSQITKTMPGRVLGKNHGIVDKIGNEYLLKGFEALSQDEVEGLVQACQARLDGYLRSS
jgi:hypothetical protein